MATGVTWRGRTYPSALSLWTPATTGRQIFSSQQRADTWMPGLQISSCTDTCEGRAAGNTPSMETNRYSTHLRLGFPATGYTIPVLQRWLHNLNWKEAVHLATCLQYSAEHKVREKFSRPKQES